MLDPLFKEISINAWTGDQAPTADAADLRWALRASLPAEEESKKFLAVEQPPDPRDWRDARVGFGVILADKADLTAATRASGEDAPEPIRRLIAERRKLAPVKVLRYKGDSTNRFSLLRDYASMKDLDIAQSARGSMPDAIPTYLLVYGSPEVIPWRLQYALNANSCVSRIALEGAELDRYITAVLDDWSGSKAQVRQPVVWSVNHGGGDISELMQNCIAKPLAKSLGEDSGTREKLTYIDDKAKKDQLISALRQQLPLLIATTSHGMTGPLTNAAAMKNNLGKLVDHSHAITSAADLVAPLPGGAAETPGWQPDGAVWYAHACCSAGSDADSNFADLVPAGSAVAQVLNAVAALGSLVSPLPTELLGQSKPLRCFIGHVEPTFDWTLRRTDTGQFLTASLLAALYAGIGRGLPLTLAFRDYYQALGALFSRHQDALKLFNQGDAAAANKITEAILAARDIRSTVILGDPLVKLPAIP